MKLYVIYVIELSQGTKSSQLKTELSCMLIKFAITFKLPVYRKDIDTLTSLN